MRGVPGRLGDNRLGAGVFRVPRPRHGLRCLLRCPWGESHCHKHRHLRDLYFQNLERFSPEELRRQAAELGKLETSLRGTKSLRKKRATLRKQVAKVEAHLAARAGA